MSTSSTPAPAVTAAPDGAAAPRLSQKQVYAIFGGLIAGMFLAVPLAAVLGLFKNRQRAEMRTEGVEAHLRRGA